MHTTPTPKTILVVDDDFSVLTMIKAMLESSDYDVAVARTADVTMSIAQRKNSVDLLLTEIAMLDVDGIQLAAKILTIHPNAKVILMSGNGRETFDAENIGEVGFLPKPFTSPMLFSAI